MTPGRIALRALALTLSLAGAAVAQSGKSGKSGAEGAPAVDLSTLEACPRNAVGIEEETLCLCRSSGAGTVWGSGPYTGDSNLCTAAVHAGVVDASGGPVRVIPSGGLESYQGSTANGVTTRDWGSFGSSFDVSIVGSGAQTADSSLPPCSTMPDGEDEHACSCPANPARGSVWGNGPYTADSDLCTAALYDGYIESTGGEVYVLRLNGLASYSGGENNGVTTSDWGPYASSITFNWNR